MSLELVPTFGTRPPVVRVGGGVVHVSVHDAEFLRQWREWRRRLAAAHPDKGGTEYRFRTALGKYRKWEFAEAKWYAQIGIDPPKQLHTLKQNLAEVVAIEAPVPLPPCRHCGKARMSDQTSTSKVFCSSACSHHWRAGKPRKTRVAA